MENPLHGKGAQERIRIQKSQEQTPQKLEEDRIEMEEQQKQEIVSDFAIYRYKNLYTVIHKGAVFDGLSSTNAKSDYAGLYEQSEKGGFDEFYIRVKSMEYKTDYFAPSKNIYCEKDRSLIIWNNPTEDWEVEDIPEADNIYIDHYSERIWDGKLLDQLQIIIFTMALKEPKLNKILLVGASNKGKTMALEMMGFVNLPNTQFLELMRGERVQSKETIDNIKRTGLILWDDAGTTLPLGVKNITNKMTIKLSGAGNIEVPCLVLGITSTHSTLLSNAEEQVANRFMQMNIGQDNQIFTEGGVSGLEKVDIERYKVATQNYVRKKILEYIEESKEKEGIRAKLVTLQDKYKIEGSANTEEIASVIIDRLKEYVQDYCESNKNITKTTRYRAYDGDYYVRSKRDYENQVNKELLELLNRDTSDIAALASKILKQTLIESRNRPKLPLGETRQNYYLLVFPR